MKRKLKLFTRETANFVNIKANQFAGDREEKDSIL
jgi:hypothetical protein